MTPEPFRPPVHLRSPHVQTLLGSRGRGYWIKRRASALAAASQREIITCSDGVRLEAWIARQKSSAPTVVLIHGWLGHAGSSYVLSSAAELWAHGFSVVRLNLRDHGETAHLNEELYNAARTREVVDAISIIEEQFATGPVGIVGFSLGGNFALRVARELDLPTVAVCPAMNPETTMRQIDFGWVGYQLFFVRKWQRAMRRKQQAFPERYRFDQAFDLSTVRALTDFFVSEYSDFATTEDYLAAYTLTGNELAQCQATIVYSEDDPVIPASDFNGLPDSLNIDAISHGGHCAFVQAPWQSAWIDGYLAGKFTQLLSSPARESSG